MCFDLSKRGRCDSKVTSKYSLEGVIRNHLIIAFFLEYVNTFIKIHGFIQFVGAGFGERGKGGRAGVTAG
jgi:hypothetical protein